MSASRRASIRASPWPATLTSIISRSTNGPSSVRSSTLWTGTSRDNCALICSMIIGVPMVTIVIKAQLSRLVPVHKVLDLTDEGPFVEREMMLVKVAGQGDARIEALRLADIYRARVVDSTLQSFVFEITGSADKLNAFIALMEPLGLVEISRTGVVAISRGARGI